jgi:hypothetical protein
LRSGVGKALVRRDVHQPLRRHEAFKGGQFTSGGGGGSSGSKTEKKAEVTPSKALLPAKLSRVERQAAATTGPRSGPVLAREVKL